MADRLAVRLKLGILVPAFNATAQPEMESLRPPGVTNHVARIDMPDRNLAADADQVAVVESLGADLFGALARVMKVRPGAVVLGISVPCFWAGTAGGAALRGRLEAAAGVPVATADAACLDLLARLPARRIGVLTPFQPVANERIAAFLREAGCESVAFRSTEAASNLAIAHAEASAMIGAMRSLAEDGCEVLLQLGTNLAFLDLAAEARRWLDRPCFAVNALLYRHALRLAGIQDVVPGCEGLD
ncbi:maleate cis-trans isomerase family protein [Roseomonas fluvialis]|uniref:IgiC protein n=1 Tax=Roseomonas fluvialis TaxID=1750527 RepID=A0ABM7Y8C3_9PROT|nr:arylmalonate decarboxylase [Roseomonas fluvialis]BDG74234.1 igiC protein [Roseomonas fluvialis]